MSTTAVDPATAVEAWLASFDHALAQGDAAAAADLFGEDGFWRDLVAFTWNITTLEGRDEIRDMLEHTLARVQPSGWATTEAPAEADGVTEAWIAFETAVGRGEGHLRLKDGKAWTLLTTLRELKGHEEPARHARPKGVEHGADTDRETWLEARTREAEELGYVTQPEVLIVGGGQGGIALGARLRSLGVPTIIVEKNARPGDSWRKRYKSLCLHDPVWYDHLPYIKFPDTWPVFSPKDKIGDWLEMYTRVMELNYWGSTEAKRATWDDEAKEWTVVVDREGAEVTLRPKQLVMATGMSAIPRTPDFPGMEDFKGEQHHSSRHPGPDAYAGKRAVVIGSNNSAHDICAALWEHGADVTMVQRTSTCIIRSQSLMEVGLGPLYSQEAVEAGVTTEKADHIFASLPYRIMHEFQIPVYDEIRERDADFYRRLEAAGFELDFGEDESGLFMKYLRRGSGYYIDVGASELVADGKIKLVHGRVERLTEDGVRMEDGTELPRRPRRLRDRLQLDERLARRPDVAGDGRQGRQGLGPRLRHGQGPRPVGGRAAQHVEADAAGGAVVPRRQPAPVALLLALPRAPAQGPRRGARHAGLRAGGGPPHRVSVTVVGSINADVALAVARLPAAGATVVSGPPVRSGGGKGANVAVAAARAGADVRLVGAVGEDAEGEAARRELAAEGIDVGAVAVRAGEATGLGDDLRRRAGRELRRRRAGRQRDTRRPPRRRRAGRARRRRRLRRQLRGARGRRRCGGRGGGGARGAPGRQPLAGAPARARAAE